MKNPLASPWIRLYGHMLRLYPEDVRSDSGQEMTDLFADLLHESQGSLSRRALFIVQACADLLGGAWKARRQQALDRRLKASRPSAPFNNLRSCLMLRHDIRWTLRQLRRSPGFALVTVFSLALGIGATTAIFSAVNAIVLRPPQGVADPASLISIFTGSPGEELYESNSLLDFEEFSRIPALESAAAFTLDILDLTTEDGRRTLMAESVSGQYFDVLKMRPALGRTFLPQEARRGDARQVTVISHSLWENEFGRDPSVIGRSVLLNQRPFTVIGVAASGFVSRVLSLKADLWVPLGIPGMVSEEVQPHNLTDRRSRSFLAIARLKPGATLEQAQAQLDLVAQRLQRAFAEDWQNPRGEALRLTAARSDSGLPPQARKRAGAALITLMVPVGLVLLIACSNVANMLLARASRRGREMALRLALGAGRGRLVRQLLMESLVLAGMGGLAGLALAWVASHQFNRLQVYGIPIPFDLRLDYRVLAFTLLTSMAAGLFFGLLPALRASRPDLVPALKQEFSGGGRSRRLSLRNLLVVTQMAGSFLLLAGSMLFLRSQQQAGSIDIGFDPRNVAAARLNLSLEQKEKSPEAILHELDRLKQRLAGSAHVESVSLAGSLPLSLVQRSASIRVEGHQALPEQSPAVEFNVVAPNYFELMRIAMAAGRSFQAADNLTSSPVALVNHAFAERYWPGQSPIGKSLQLESADQAVQVVGVVADHKLRFLGDEARPHFWIPLAQNPAQPFLMVLARTRGEMGEVLAQLRREIEDYSGHPPLLAPAPLEQMIDVSLIPNRLATTFLGLTGMVALFLALAGIYGVVAYTVSQRRREMGIRMAVGAAKSSVIGLVLRQGLSLTGSGLLIGAPLAMGFGAVVSHLLYGVSPFDPWTFLGVASALALAAALASFVPALRAASVDPACTLRFE